MAGGPDGNLLGPLGVRVLDGLGAGGEGAHAADEHVWVDSQDQAVGTATKPPVDLPYWYQNAMPGPAAYCTSGTFPAAFDNDGTLNGSVGTVNFLTSTPYDCVVDSGGTTVGEIRWTPGNPASLYINGVVFIDGNISMSNSYKIDYTGLGTIYASGSIYLGGSLQLCGARNGGSCDWTTGAWDPEQTLLAWVAGTTLELDSSVQLQGALYATTDYTQTSSVHEQGPVVTTNLYFQSSAQTRWLPFVHLAPGMPQRASFGGATLVPGTWNG